MSGYLVTAVQMVGDNSRKLGRIQIGMMLAEAPVDTMAAMIPSFLLRLGPDLLYLPASVSLAENMVCVSSCASVCTHGTPSKVPPPGLCTS